MFEKLNDVNHTFIIAEAGSNWKIGLYEEDLEQAEKLIDVAYNSGADAIKFQIFRPEKVYSQNAGQISYLKNQQSQENIIDLFKHLAMPYEMISVLAQKCNKLGIMFMSTPFSTEDAEEIDPYVQIHKIASYEINHLKLLEFVSKTKKPIIISTGASTYDEIDFAINTLKNNNSGPIAILQCTASYPSPNDALNISVIPKFIEKYNVPVGLSDHSVDPLVGPLLAIGMGATIIEKHFTLDKNAKGPDHFFALEPHELINMIQAIRKADSAKGSSYKKITSEEQELHKFASRSIQAIKKIKKGDLLENEKNIAILRPGNNKRGADARFFNEINGKKSIRDIDIGEGVSLKDCN